jgi:hypothetical protein
MAFDKIYKPLPLYTATAAAYTVANGLTNVANTTNLAITSVFVQANAGYSQANLVFAQANAAYTQGNTVSAALAQANNAYSQANLVFAAANSAAQTMPQNAQTAPSLGIHLQLSDAGKHIYLSGATTSIIYLPTTANVPFANGTTIMLISNTSAAANVTITPNGNVALFLTGNTQNSSKNLTTKGVAQLMVVSANTYYIWGLNGPTTANVSVIGFGG